MRFNLLRRVLGKHPVYTLLRYSDGTWDQFQGAGLVPWQLNSGKAAIELGNAESISQALVREGKINSDLKYASIHHATHSTSDWMLWAHGEDEMVDFSAAILTLKPTVGPLKYISVAPLGGAQTLCRGIWHCQGGHAHQQLLYMPTGAVVVVQHTTLDVVDRYIISWNTDTRSFDIRN